MATNLGIEQDADESIADLINQLRSEIEAKLNMKCTLFEAVKYRKQTVRGTNFYVKIKVAGSSEGDVDVSQANNNNQPTRFIHVRFWRDLPVNNFKLTLYDKLELDKLELDPIDYFE